MDAKDLLSGRFGVSSGNSTTPVSLTAPVPQPEPLYQVPVQANPARMEDQTLYLPYGRQYVQAALLEIKIVLTLEQALKLRSEQWYALTIREADIAARQRTKLNVFLFTGLRSIGGILTEGIPGEQENPYSLREFYNRGVKFKKDFWQTSDAARRLTAEAAMKVCLDKLAAIGLPAWPEEVEQGFVLELTKPEYMDWSQYQQAKQRRTVRSDSRSGEIVSELDAFRQARQTNHEAAGNPEAQTTDRGPVAVG